jgi:hypothetical protein
VPRTLVCLAGAALLSGTLMLSHAAARLGGDRDTFAMESKDRVLFLAIQADYPTLGVEEVARILREDFTCSLVGDSVRSQSNPQRRVWAVRTSDTEATLKELKRGTRKKGLVVERMVASVLAPGRDPANNATARVIESLDERIWAGWVGPGGATLWIFHESRLTLKALEKALDGAKLPSSWHHEAFDLSSAAQPAADLSLLAKAAPERLDLLCATPGEGLLALDIYLRNLDTLAIVQQDDQSRLCPDFRGRLIEAVAPGTTGWRVTFAHDGYPFL